VIGTPGPRRTGTPPLVGTCTIGRSFPNDGPLAGDHVTLVICNTRDMVPSMPKVVDIAERRNELAAAAAQLIARSAVRAATLREVAAEAGWTTGALPPYFADKRELLRFTFASSLAERHAAHAATGDRTPRQQLMDSLEGALPLDEDRRRHWMVTVALCAQAVGDDELSEVQ